MLPLAHVGFTLLAAEVASLRFRGVRTLPWAWLAAGALLPDLFDKPLAFFVIQNNSSRLIAHTLLFALGLGALAWISRGRGRWDRALGGLAAGVGAHLVLDQMWRDPARLLWPLLGWRFPAGEAGIERYLLDYLRAWPEWLPLELAGALSLALAVALRRRRAP